MKFEWDELKAKANQKKHGISFDLAITVFDDPSALIAPDPKHSTVEDREWIIGEGNVYRLISARKANRRERKLYEEFKKLSF